MADNSNREIPSQTTGLHVLAALSRIEALLRLMAADNIEEAKATEWTEIQEAIYEACDRPRAGAEIAKIIDKPWGNFNKTLYRMVDKGWLVCFHVNGKSRYAQGL